MPTYKVHHIKLTGAAKALHLVVEWQVHLCLDPRQVGFGQTTSRHVSHLHVANIAALHWLIPRQRHTLHYQALHRSMHLNLLAS